jgi:hypothetical protein
MAVNIELLFEKIRSRGLFQSIERFQYAGYDMKVALQTVEAIGRSRNPKFVIDGENRFVYENMVRWIHGDPEMRCLSPDTRKPVPGRLTAGIYITGNTGAGKSWALEIMAAYCLFDGVRVKIGDAVRGLYWPNVRADAICDEYVAGGTVEKYKKMSVIGIQDLGSEPAESLYMGNRAGVMRQILEYRGDHTDKITLVTSNFSINHAKFVERYGDRVASRLYEMCNYFEIVGTDRRKFKL